MAKKRRPTGADRTAEEYLEALMEAAALIPPSIPAKGWTLTMGYDAMDVVKHIKSKLKGWEE